MEKRTRWISANGKQILYFDFSNLKIQEFVKEMTDGIDFLKTQNKKDVLILINAADTNIYGEGLKMTHVFAKEIKPYRKKSALIGVQGVKQILLNSVLKVSGTSSVVNNCKSYDEAIEWLTR